MKIRNYEDWIEDDDEYQSKRTGLRGTKGKATGMKKLDGHREWNEIPKKDKKIKAKGRKNTDFEWD